MKRISIRDGFIYFSLFTIYLCSAWLGLKIAPIGEFATLVWPPTGIACTALLLFGNRFYPSIFFGALSVNIIFGAPILSAIGMALGNSLEAVVGVYLLRTYGFNKSLSRLKDVILLICLAAILSTLLSASIGTASLWLGNAIQWDQFRITWGTWWIGDMLGLMIVTPLILVWIYHVPKNLTTWAWIELSALIALLVLISFTVFAGIIAPLIDKYHLAFLLFPLIIWAAFRFGQFGSANATAIISGIAIWGITSEQGLAPSSIINKNLLVSYIYISIMTVVGIVLAAILQERKDLLTQLQLANSAKDNFLAILSHELRTPLNVILGWSQMLQKEKLGGDSVRQAYKTIERNALIQSKLINDLLDISRIETGKLELEKTIVNLTLITNSVVETFRLAANAKEIRLTVNASPVPAILGDPVRLQQVISNLLSNAIKFTPVNGSIEIVLKPQKSFIQIMVKDSGFGIDPEFLPHVFDSFFQEDSGTTRTFGGLGLGLSLVRHIVQLHGGSVRASSRGRNLGATFSVKLPIPLENTAPKTKVLQKIQLNINNSNGTRLSGIHVLLVDDSLDVLTLLSIWLKKEGAMVTKTTSAKEALAVLQETKPDVLLSAIGMPEEDGYSLIRRVRQLNRAGVSDIPAAALTAYAQDEESRMALAAGFQMHLSKPIDAEVLITATLKLAFSKFC